MRIHLLWLINLVQLLILGIVVDKPATVMQAFESVYTELLLCITFGIVHPLSISRLHFVYCLHLILLLLAHPSTHFRVGRVLELVRIGRLNQISFLCSYFSNGSCNGFLVS